MTAVGRDRMPPDVSLNDRLQVRRPDGKAFVVMVTGLSEQNATLDANHPLAGKDLTFDIELVGIE